MSENKSSTPATSTPAASPRRRWLFVFITILVLLSPVLLGLVLLGALEFNSFRSAVAARAAERLEDATGLSLTMGDFSLDVYNGELTLESLRLAAYADAAPFFTAERLRAEFAWRELLGSPRVVRRIEIERSTLDLRQPLPAGEDGEGETSLPLEIRSVSLAAGRVLGPPVAADTWLEAWSAEDLEIAGELTEERLSLALEKGRLRLERASGEPLELTAGGRVAGPLAGPYEIDSLELVGEGLNLHGAATLGLDAAAERTARLRLEADLARLFPELLESPPGAPPAAGTLEAHADLDLRAFTGQLDATATGFPLAALEPWTGRLLAPGDAPAFVDLKASFSGDRAGDPQLGGEAHLDLRRAGRTLVSADARLAEGRLTTNGIDLESLVGEVEARASALPAELLRPWLRRAAPDSDLYALFEVAGTSFDLDAEARLEAADPGAAAGRAELAWRRGRETLTRATVRTVDTVRAAGNGDGEETSVGLAFDATLLPASPGRRALRGRLDAPSWSRLDRGELRDTRLELELPDLAAALADLETRWPKLAAALGREALPLTLAGAVNASAELSGPLNDPAAKIAATWTLAEDSRLLLAASGNPLERRGEIKLEIDNFDPARLQVAALEPLEGPFDATLELDATSFDGRPQSLSARLTADAADLRWGDGPPFEAVHLEARADGKNLLVDAFAARFEGGRYRGDARLALAPLFEAGKIRRAGLRLVGDQPATGVDRFELDAVFMDGTVRIPRLAFEAPTGNGDLEAEIPLGALETLLKVDFADLPMAVTEGPIHVDLGFPDLDLAPLLEDFDLEAPWQSHRLGLTGRLVIDPTQPAAAQGEILVENWRLEIDEHRLETTPDEALLFNLGDGRLELLPVRIRLDGRPLDVEGSVELALGWRLGEDPAALLAAYELSAEGMIATELLNPFLAGGVAEGPARIQLSVRGQGDQLSLSGSLDGPRATLVYRDPYLTRIAAPRLEFTYAAGEIDFETTRLQLNEGQAELSGYRADNGDWFFRATFDDVRYRVDYGLSTVLEGDLALDLPSAGRGLLIGDVTVERGLLRRDLNLDREVMGSLFSGAPAMTGATVDWREDVDMDVSVVTAEGIRIRNNLADLRATWSRLELSGSLAEPAVRGMVDLEPGGRLSAYGQVARVDQGTLRFTGEPGVAPEIELSTTSSLEDPSLRQLTGGQLAGEWRSERGGEEPSANRQSRELLAEGLASYYGGQVFEQLGLEGISIQPVLIFGETDPSTSLVVSRNLLPQVAFAVAIDLRDSQNQTYLLDLHRFRALPRVSFQAFSDSEEGEGATAQQQLFFGPGKGTRDEDHLPRLVKVTFSGIPAELSRDALRDAVVYERNQPLPEGADFDVEVDVAELLRRRGYPGARVEAEIVELDARRVEMRVALTPGPRTVFEFTGTTPPVALRREIVSAYRVDYYEEASLEEIRQQAVRALRSQGFLEPRVEIKVERDPNQADHANQADRTVTIAGEGGRRIQLDEVRFGAVGEDALPAAVVQRLASRFPSQTARVELAAAEPEADEWLRTNLRALGYPEARIEGRRLSEDGRLLTVEIAPGPRQSLARIAVEGLPAGVEEEEYLGLLPIQEGDTPRRDLVAAGSLSLRHRLEENGYTEARVRTELTESEPGAAQMELVYRVEPGPRYRLDEIRFAGLEATRDSWARRVTELEPGEHVSPEDLGKARRNLFRTGLFETVRSKTEHGETEHGETGSTTLTFELDEIPRFRLAYGLRWESEAGLALVVDGVDRNFLGRGITLGLRGLYASDEEAARFYFTRSGFTRRRGALEFFLEVRDELDRGVADDPFDNFIVESIDSTVRYSYPWKGLTSRVYASWRREMIREEDPLFPDFPFEETLELPVIGWQLLYDTRDDALAPTRGFLASTDLSVSGDYLGSNFDFIRLFAQLSWVRPAFEIGGVRFTWGQGYRFGWLESQDDIPLTTERFEAGGEFSVRGYPNDSLEDDPLGGQTLLVVNQELRFPVWGRLGGVVFFDAGNAWADPNDFASDFFTSAGIGVRADTPIGLTRLDFAWPLDRREDDSPLRIYFGFGHAF